MRREDLGLVFEKTGGTCWYCARILSPFSDWEVEHQIPTSRGGSNDISNLVPSCKNCNRLKGARTVEEFRNYLKLRMLARVESFVDEQHRWQIDENDAMEVWRHLKSIQEITENTNIIFYWEMREKELIQADDFSEIDVE